MASRCCVSRRSYSSAGVPPERRASIDRDHPVDRAPFGGADKVLVGDPDRMKGGLDLAAPMIEEAVQLRELRRDVIFLPDEQLDELGVVRHVIADLRRQQAVALQLDEEIARSE